MQDSQNIVSEWEKIQNNIISIIIILKNNDEDLEDAFEHITFVENNIEKLADKTSKYLLEKS